MEDYDSRIQRAGRLLAAADYILIGGGAGLSDAAGIHYYGKRFTDHFAEFIQRYGMTDMYSAGFYPFGTEEEKWAYWAKHILMNRFEEPAGEVYVRLWRLIGGRDYFVLTTNVDGQFEKAGFDRERVFEVQGNYGLIQCAAGCHPKTYPDEEVVRAMAEQTRDLKVPAALVPRCPVCGGRMDVNLRKDGCFVQDSGWYESAKRYQSFLDKTKGKKIVYLEMGVGFNTPGIIRYPFELMTNENPEATLIRCNRDTPAGIPENAGKTIAFTEDMNKVVKDMGTGYF